MSTSEWPVLEYATGYAYVQDWACCLFSRGCDACAPHGGGQGTVQSQRAIQSETTGRVTLSVSSPRVPRCFLGTVAAYLRG